MKTVSFIIVNWNTKGDLLECLQAIRNNVDPEYIKKEIIVVDNNSTDGSSQAVKDKFSSVTIIENKVNKGFAVGCNQGIRKSQGDFILLINPDIKIQPRCIITLVNFINCNTGVGAVGPMLIGPDGAINNYGYYVKFPNIFQFVLFRTPLKIFAERSKFLKKFFMGTFDPDESFEVDQPPGAFIMVKREVIEKIGLLDETFFLYFEDVDFALRIKRAGWKIFYVAEAQVIHRGSSSTRKLSDPTRRFYFYSSASKYFAKHKNYLYAFSIMFICELNIMFTVLRVLPAVFKGKKEKKVVKDYLLSALNLLRS